MPLETPSVILKSSRAHRHTQGVDENTKKMQNKNQNFHFFKFVSIMLEYHPRSRKVSLDAFLELFIAQKSSWRVPQHNINKFEKTQNFDFLDFFHFFCSNQELDLGSDWDFGRIFDQKCSFSELRRSWKVPCSM